MFFADAATDFETSGFHQDVCNRYLFIGFDLAHIPWRDISILEQQQSYQALQSNLVGPSTTTLTIICQMEN